MIRVGNTGSVVLPNWKCICNNKKNNMELSNFIKTTRTKSPTGNTGASTLLPIGTGFMYMETSGDSHANNVFVSFERTDIIQITKITFLYNRFSILTIDNLKAM